MPQRETLKLLNAIQDFRDAYSGDPAFSKIIEQLSGLENSVEKVSQGESPEGGQPERDTPGSRASESSVEGDSPFGGGPSDEDRKAASETDGPVKEKARALLDRMQSKESSGPSEEEPPARSEDSGEEKEKGDRSGADIPAFLRKAAERGGAREQDRKKKKRPVFTARS